MIGREKRIGGDTHNKKSNRRRLRFFANEVRKKGKEERKKKKKRKEKKGREREGERKEEA